MQKSHQEVLGHAMSPSKPFVSSGKVTSPLVHRSSVRRKYWGFWGDPGRVYGRGEEIVLVASYEKGSCQICICLFDLSEVEY